MGREVAEAFIEVHGDLSPFRKDLDGANEAMAKLARQSADTFQEEWGKRMAAGVDRQWKSVVDSMYSAEPIDPNRLIKDFNSSDLDEAQEKINAFLKKMSEHQKLTGTNYKATKKALNDALNAARDQQEAEERLAKDRQAWNRAHLDMMDEFNKRQTEQADEQKALQQAWARANDDMVKQFREIRKAYDESFDGMFKADQSKRMADDLKAMVAAMSSADWSKFAKSFDSLDGMRDRINEVNKAMFEQGRMSSENISRVTRDAEQWITLEEAKQAELLETSRLHKLTKEQESKLNAEALDAARKAREEAEAFDRTLEGLVQKGMISKTEKDFRSLSDAIARNDWSGISRGHRNFEEMRAEVERLISTMRAVDRVGDETFDLLNEALDDMRHNAAAYNLQFRTANAAAGEHEESLFRSSILMTSLGKGAENLSRKLVAMGGFNLVLDSLRAGSEFMSNLDRNAVAFGKTITAVAAGTSLLTSSLGGAVTIISDIGATFGGLAAFAPAFISGLGIGVGVLIASFKDMKDVLADLGPSFDKLQDNISKAFWNKAAQPIRELTNTLMPVLNTRLTETGELMGEMFAKFANLLKEDLGAGRLDYMFERLNKAMAISQGMVEPLTKAFLVLGDWGSKYFERFATWLVKISDQFYKFIEASALNGDLDRWMEGAIQGMKDLWSIGSSVTDIFNAINDSATMAGSKGLHGFAENMAEIEKVISSQRFGAAMVIAFRGAYETLDGIKRGFLLLGPAIESFLPTYTDIMGKFGGIFENVFKIIAGFISNNSLQKGLEDFVGGIAKAIQNLLPAVEPTAKSLGGLFDLMGDVLDVGSKLLSEVLIKLGPEFDKVVDAIKPLVAPAGALGSSLIDALADILKVFAEDILPPVVRLLGELIPVLTDTLNEIDEEDLKRFSSLGDAINFLADSVKNLKAALAPLREGGDLEWLGDMLFSGGGAGGNAGSGNPIEDAITNLFNGIDWEGLGGMIADGWNRIWEGNIFGDQPGKFFREADDNMNQWWDDTIGSWWDDTIGPWFDGIKGMMEDAWNGFTEFLDGLFGGGGEGGDKGMVGGRSIGSAIGLEDLEDPSKWEEFGTKIRDSVTTFFTGVGAWITEQSALLKTGWDEFWGGFGTKVEEVWTGFWEFIVTKYTEISTGLTEWWTGVKLGWDMFWDGVRLKAEEIWNGITTWIQTKTGEIKTGIDTWITDVRTNWDNFWAGIRTKVEETWNNVLTFIDTKRNEIKANIDSFINGVRTNWDNFWAGVGNTVSTKWNEMTGWINGKVGEIRSNIDNFIGTVRSNWDNGWAAVGQTVQREWNNLTSTISTKVGEIVGFVQTLPDRIRNFFNVDLSGAGAAIMQSFLGGLQSSWGAVTDFVGGIASWIQQNKGPIELDRKLLIPAGMAIMGSLVSGLKGGMPGLERQVNAVTNTILDNMTEGLSRSAMYVAGADAALGLADGLASKKGTVEDVFKNLLPDTSDLRVSARSASGAVDPAAPAGTVINVEAGAIPITTPTKDPEIVASKVIDGFANFSNL